MRVWDTFGVYVSSLINRGTPPPSHHHHRQEKIAHQLSVEINLHLVTEIQLSSFDEKKKKKK